MAKAKKAKGKRRNATPKLHTEQVANCRTPHTTESSGRLATALIAMQSKIGVWKEAVRKHFVEGGKTSGVPEFNPNHFCDLNRGQLTQAQLEKLQARQWEGEAVSMPARYNPLFVDAIHETGAVSLRSGSIKNHPKPPSNWDEKKDGSWYLLDEDDKRTIESGWFYEKKMPRRCHSQTAEAMVTDPDDNILTFGNNRYVVGDGTSVRSAAILLSATKRGNYLAGDTIRKRLSLAGNKDVVDAVFRIEDRANNGGGVTLKAKWKGGVEEVVMLPGQALTAGFLFDAKGKRLSAKDIRGLDEDTKGLKFKTVRQVLGGPIIGKPIAWSKIWEQLKIADKKNIAAMREREGRSDEYEAGTPQDKSLVNHEVTCRVSPTEIHPFGFHAAQADMVPYKISGGEEMQFGAVIGDRSNLAYNTKEVDEAEDAEKSTKKATKKATKPDAAPPVEADTADEVEEEVEVEASCK